MGFKAETIELIEKAKKVLALQTEPISIRGLYYQLISQPKDPIEPGKRSYKRVIRAMTRAREEGIIAWDAFSDKTRRVITPNGWTDINQFAAEMPRYFRRERQQTQEQYLELWVEKEALVHLFEPYAYEFGITVRVGRGYNSGSALNEFAKKAQEEYRSIKVLYFGDWDPSGLDIDRSFDEKLMVNFDTFVEVERVALTEYDTTALPHNPVKKTDTRAKKYIAKYGDKTWELDALTNQQIKERIADAIYQNIDFDLFKKELEKEDKEKSRFTESLKRLKT
ncbi:MAG TPA: hypothetical protein VF303_02100 [Candidatus Nanoarchaeia archaeon]